MTIDITKKKEDREENGLVIYGQCLKKKRENWKLLKCGFGEK